MEALIYILLILVSNAFLYAFGFREGYKKAPTKYINPISADDIEVVYKKGYIDGRVSAMEDQGGTSDPPLIMN